MNLYEIVEQVELVGKAIEENQGELDNNLDNMSSLVFSALTQKTDGCANYIHRMNDQIDAANNRVKELQSFIKAKKHHVENFKKYIIYCLDSANLQKVEGNVYSFKKTKPREQVEITNADIVDGKFKTEVVTTKVSKTAIKKAIEAGEEVNGAKIILGESGLKITIGGKMNE